MGQPALNNVEAASRRYAALADLVIAIGTQIGEPVNEGLRNHWAKRDLIASGYRVVQAAAGAAA